MQLEHDGEWQRETCHDHAYAQQNVYRQAGFTAPHGFVCGSVELRMAKFRKYGITAHLAAAG